MTPELQEAATSGATGVLSILTTSPVVTGGVFFQNGQVVAAAVNGRTPALGRRLVGTNLVDPIAIERLFPQGGADINPQVGSAAVRAGFLEQGVLEAVHLEYLVDDLDVLLASVPAESKFHVGREPDRFAIAPMSLSGVMRTLDERRELCGQVWNRLGMEVGPDMTVPHVVGLADGCSTFAQSLAAWLDGSRTLTEAALDSGFSRFEAIVLIGELVNAGVVRLELYVPPPVLTEAPTLPVIDPNAASTTPAGDGAVNAGFALAQFTDNGLEDTNTEDWTSSFQPREAPVSAPDEDTAAAPAAIEEFGSWPTETEPAAPAASNDGPGLAPFLGAAAVAGGAAVAAGWGHDEDTTTLAPVSAGEDVPALAPFGAATETPATPVAPAPYEVPPLAPVAEDYPAVPAYNPPAPSFEPPSFEPPSFEPPSFAAPVLAATVAEPPAPPAPAYNAPQVYEPTPAMYEPEPFEPAAYQPPAYEPPAYEPPAYEPPAHQPPAYEPPAFQPPAYEPPAFDANAYAVPTYEQPAPPAFAPPTLAPVPTDAAPPAWAPPEPQTFAPPAYEPPTFEQPSYQPPAFDPPVAPVPTSSGTEFQGPPSAEMLDAAVAAASARAVAAARQRRLSASTRFAILVQQYQDKRAQAAVRVEKKAVTQAAIEDVRLLQLRLSEAQARVTAAQQANSEATLQLLTAQQAEALWRARLAQVSNTIDQSTQHMTAVEDQLVMAQGELNNRRTALLNAEENLRVSKNQYDIAQIRHKSAAIDVVAARLDNQQVRDRKAELEAAYAAAVESLRAAEASAQTTAAEHSAAAQEAARITSQLAAVQASIGEDALPADLRPSDAPSDVTQSM